MRISVVKHWHVLLEYILPTEEHLHPKRMCCSIPDLDSCSDIFAKIFLKPDFLLVEHTVHAPTKKKKKEKIPFPSFLRQVFWISLPGAGIPNCLHFIKMTRQVSRTCL